MPPERAFAEGPVERVGAILNFSLSATRDDVLDGLEQKDSGFAKQVRRAIFTFANIPDRIDPRDVPKITRIVDPVQLITALAAATGDHEKVTEFILSSMSKRMAAQLREEMQDLGEIKEKDGEAAMTAVVIAIRELEASGDIFLVAEDE
ncbi:MAG: FliG C-terminal domain-containing protein [Paracoccaceae bacterium]